MTSSPLTPSSSASPLEHGGRLHAIAQQYNRPVADWLDVSTGIVPESYPLPDLPSSAWHRLPEITPSFLKAASDYYGCDSLLPVAGSQSVIQHLPAIVSRAGRKPSRVWVPHPGYKEHEKAWTDAGIQVYRYRHLPHLTALKSGDIVVVINPNNPTGTLEERTTLAPLQEQLHALNGLLIIDEAFMDCTPEHSMLQSLHGDNLLVLRSAGKFFGLAGIRAGFLFASRQWRERCSAVLGPWQINGPALHVLESAFNDVSWQSARRRQLNESALWMGNLLTTHFGVKCSGTPLFCTMPHPRAPDLFSAFCAEGVYPRLTDEKDALRFGMVTVSQRPRLAQVVARVGGIIERP